MHSTVKSNNYNGRAKLQFRLIIKKKKIKISIIIGLFFFNFMHYKNKSYPKINTD